MKHAIWIWVLGFSLAVACGGDDAVTIDARPPDAAAGPCDAAPVDLCGLCPAGTCVELDTESGFDSCTDYNTCVTTDLDCPPGTCTTECAEALCPAGYTCDPAAIGRYRCTKP